MNVYSQDCVWCNDMESDTSEYAGFKVGCIKRSSSHHTCTDMLEPDNKTDMIITQDDGFENNPKTGSFVQLRPQAGKIKMLPKMPQEVEFQVQIANKPVDIYFLMDLSASMKFQKDNLQTAAIEISDAIGTLTSDYMVGFGSYSDKPTFPFSKEKRSYEAEGKKTPYAFKHEVTLTRDKQKFQRAVRDSELTNNVDNPESGLDAMSQALACDHEMDESQNIGWRKKSEGAKRVIIVITDQEMHYALDGLLAGIVMPYDMKCHTDTNNTGMYSKELDLDYPSFGQIRYLTNKAEASVIFLVDQFKLNWYKKFSRFIQNDDSMVQKLEKSKEKLVDIVKNQYEKIKKRMEIRTETNSEDIKVTLESKNIIAKCDKENDQICCTNEDLNDGLVCKNITETVVVTAKLEMPNKKICTSDEKKQTIFFKLFGSSKDKLALTIECQKCECKDPGVENSEMCSKSGTFACNSCQCKEGFKGRKCECETDSINEELRQKCKDEESGLECGGHGKCHCGICTCDKGYLGPKCLQSIHDCPKHNGQEACGGKDAGVCIYDENAENKVKCECNNRYDGSACQCKISDDECQDARSGSICLGRGSCQCKMDGKKCQCEPGFRGKFCQISIGQGICQKLSPCVFNQLDLDSSKNEDWMTECHNNTNINGVQMFGNSFKIAAKGPKSVNGEQQIRFCKNQADKKSCFKMFNNDPDGNSNDLHTKKTNTDLKQCAPEYAGCEYKFYYEKKIESVNYYNADQDDNDEVFIFFRQKDIEDTNENEWVPQIKCSEIPMAELIGAAGGVLATTIVVAIIVTVVIINLKDMREWRKFVAQREANSNWAVQMNPLFKENTTATENFGHGRK